MTYVLRFILIITSVLTIIYMLRKIKKSQMNIDDSIFWLVFSMGLFIFSIIPSIPIMLARLVGIESPVNFIFLAIIFILLIKMFLMTVRISVLDNKVKCLVQKISIEESKKNQEVEH